MKNFINDSSRRETLFVVEFWSNNLNSARCTMNDLRNVYEC